jgi:hypothetical protein
MIDLGDRMQIFTVVLDAAGVPVEAAGADPAITLEVRSPAGTDPEWTDITDSITLETDADLGDGTTGPQYSALFTPGAAGTWAYRWTTAGTYVGVDYAQFVVVDHASDAHPTWTIEGYQLHTGVVVPDSDVPRVDMAIKLAAAYVQRMSAQRIEQVADDEAVFDGNGNRILFMPQRPVTNVSEVTVDGDVWVVGTDYDWSERRGTIHALGRRRWPVGQRNIAITYTHGYAEMPVDIQGLVYGLAQRAIDNPTGIAIRSETLGSYSVAYEALIGGLTAQEAAMIADLRLPNGVAA